MRLVRAFDAIFRLVDAWKLFDHFVDTARNIPSGVLHDAIQAFLTVLDGYTLADLIKPQRALSLLLLDWRAARGP
jgi:hypothetical protein